MFKVGDLIVCKRDTMYKITGPYVVCRVIDTRDTDLFLFDNIVVRVVYVLDKYKIDKNYLKIVYDAIECKKSYEVSPNMFRLFDSKDSSLLQSEIL